MRQKDRLFFSGNQVAETYFYSVSAGVSSGTKEVWFAKKDRSYLMPCVLLGDSRKTLDLQKESDFSKFLKDELKVTTQIRHGIAGGQPCLKNNCAIHFRKDKKPV